MPDKPDKPNPFRNAINARKREKQPDVEPPTDTAPEQEQPLETTAAIAPEPSPPEPLPQVKARKRGRPPTGKRSDDEWIGRTFYIRQTTDWDVEEMLVKLRRQGVEVDKSELVQMLLAAWVKWQQGDNLEIHLGEISPIQKSKKSKS